MNNKDLIKHTTIENSKRVKIAEQRAVSWILNNPEEVIKTAIFSEDLFTTEDYKQIYVAVRDLVNENVPVTPIAIVQKIADTTELSISDITSLSKIKNDHKNIDDVIKDLNSTALQVKASTMALGLAEDLLRTDITKDEIDAKVMEILTNASLSQSEKGEKFQSLKEWLIAYREKFLKRKGKKQYPFGDPLLDKAIVRGAEPGSIGIFSATTGMGKTTVVKKIQKDLEKINVPVLWISLEMTGESQMDRKLAEKYNIPFEDLTNPTDPLIYQKILDIIDQEIKDSETNRDVAFSDNPTWDFSKLRQAIIEFQKKTGSDYCVVIIDLLTMLVEFCRVRNGMNFAQSIEVSMNLLSALAKETNSHIIGTVQFGRKADSVKIMDFDDIPYTRPSLNDLKNSNALAERARYVIGLHRPKAYAEKYLADKEETKEMEDIIYYMVLKQNEGPTPTLQYLFDPKYFSINPIGSDTSLNEKAEVPEAENHMV